MVKKEYEKLFRPGFNLLTNIYWEKERNEKWRNKTTVIMT